MVIDCVRVVADRLWVVLGLFPGSFGPFLVVSDYFCVVCERFWASAAEIRESSAEIRESNRAGWFDAISRFVLDRFWVVQDRF